MVLTREVAATHSYTHTRLASAETSSKDEKISNTLASQRAAAGLAPSALISSSDAVRDGIVSSAHYGSYEIPVIISDLLSSFDG